MEKLTAENIREFVTDMRALEEAGEMETVDNMVSKMRQDFKPLGRNYTDKMLDLAATSLSAEDPMEQIESLNQLGTFVEDPNAFFRVQPQESKMRVAGKSALGSALRPFAGPEGQAAYDKWRETGGGASQPGTAKAAGMLGGMVPEMITQAVIQSNPALRAMHLGGPAASGAIAGGAMGAAQGDSTLGGALQGAISGGAGGAAGKLIANRFLPVASKQPQPTQDLVLKQQKKGYWASPGYQSGRKSAEQLDNAIKKRHSTADAVHDLNTANRKKLNREVAGAVGLPSGTNNLDVDTLKIQNNNLTDQLDDFYLKAKPVYTKGDSAIPRQAASEYRSSTGLDIPKEFSHFTERYQALINKPKAGPKDFKQQKANSKALRALVRDLNKRMTYHYTDNNGNPELAKAYRKLYNQVEGGILRNTGRKELNRWKTIRDQQGLLLDLVAKDKGMLRTGNVTPSSLLGIHESGKTHNLSYVNKRRDLWDSARFIHNQEQALDNSLAVNQRIGHYLNPMESAGIRPILAAAGRGAPMVNDPLINTYLKGRYIRTPADELKANIAGGLGAVGAIDAQEEYDLMPGILDL